MGRCLSDEIFSDHPELWELRSDDPQTLLEGFENGIKIAGENGDFIGIPNKGNDQYYSFKFTRVKFQYNAKYVG